MSDECTMFPITTKYVNLLQDFVGGIISAEEFAKAYFELREIVRLQEKKCEQDKPELTDKINQLERERLSGIISGEQYLVETIRISKSLYSELEVRPFTPISEALSGSYGIVESYSDDPEILSLDRRLTSGDELRAIAANILHEILSNDQIQWDKSTP